MNWSQKGKGFLPKSQVFIILLLCYGLFTIIVRKGQVMKFQIFINTLAPQTLSQQSATIRSSKNRARHCQVAVSSVRNVVKKCQLKGKAEVKLTSGWPRKLSERTAQIAKKANQKPCLTVKDFQEDLADCGVVVHCPPVQGYLPKYDLHGSMFGEERVKMFWTSWAVKHGGWRVSYLCCSQWRREYVTGRGKNGFN